jgi:hypothetical protein
MNFPPKNWEGYFAYSQRVGGKLWLLIGVRTLPLLRCSIRTLPCICLMIYLGLVHDNFFVVLYDRYRVYGLGFTFLNAYILKTQGQTSKMLLDWDQARLFNNQGECLPMCTAQSCPTAAKFPSLFLLYPRLFFVSYFLACGARLRRSRVLHTWFFILRFF